MGIHKSIQFQAFEALNILRIVKNLLNTNRHKYMTINLYIVICLIC